MNREITSEEGSTYYMYDSSDASYEYRRSMDYTCGGLVGKRPADCR